jgi:pyridoxal phosphate phosphatase PHOSPHO2
MDPRSMADQDTDRWIFEVLAPDLRRKMKTLKDEIQWTDLVWVVSFPQE